jgi:peptidyl-prolyl cis-trans isomerase C
VSKLLAGLLVAGSMAFVFACRQPAANAVSTTASAQSTPAPAAQQPPAGTAQPPAPTAPKPMPAELPEVLARVNGEPVTKTDFDRIVKNLELGNGPIPANRRDAILRGALDQLITYTALMQEAKARNISATDAEVDQRLKQMQSQFRTDDDFKKALADRNMTLERLRNDTRINAVIHKMIEAETANQPEATDVQVREFYDKNPGRFMKAETVRASHILIKVPPQADEETKKKARAQIESVLKEAKAGADFAQLAKDHSQDGSAAQGGDLNFFGRGQMVPPFEQVAFALKPGEISDIVTTQFGFHVIKVTEKRPASAVPFEEVNPRIRQHLAQEQRQARIRAFIESIKNRAKIEVLV